MHTGKELETLQLEKGHLSCDSDVPKVGNVRSDATEVVKVNRRKKSRRKTKPYSVCVCVCVYVYIYTYIYIYRVCLRFDFSKALLM